LDAAAKEISGLVTVVCDISKCDDIERMVAASQKALGGLDVLMNNAGIAGPTAPVEEADPDHWEAVMTVDVIGTFHVTRLCIPHLKKSSAGSIIVMSSLGGRFGYSNRSAYCTAKMGLIGFAKSLSRELGHIIFAQTPSRPAQSAVTESNWFFRAAPAQNTSRWRRKGWPL
jgi:NAD(P)-dependent dehydrogenase (short-subunit alcohol dehydrogenase family)